MAAEIDERGALISLNMMENVGPVTADLLAEALGSFAAIFTAEAGTMLGVPGIGRKTVEAIVGQRESLNWKAEECKAEGNGIRIITRVDSEYPRMLKSVHDPPLALYARGEFKSSDSSSVGVVGTRRPTHYGREVTERFSFTLAQAGITVVSGLALGIDTTAHRSAVRAGGRTIAVMGSGFDHVYPGSNAQLCDEIARHGVVISEFPLAKRPDKTTFPMRNRIVSGLSKAVLIVEAGQKSGALITADQALEQGRAVFAVPGRIDNPRSMGVNALIKDGARPATCPDDVLEEFETLFPAARQETQGGGQTQLDEKERQLLRILESGPTEVDSLIRHSDLDPGTVSSLLIGLEMKKKVRMLPGRTVEMR